MGDPEDEVGQVSHTCRHCGAKSYNINDWLHRYCGRCHHFCDDVDWAMRLRIFRLLCPRCGAQPKTITRGLGKATLYEPCGHTGLLTRLKVKDV